MDKPLISPEHVAILESGAAGAFLSLLFQGKVTWWRALLVFTSGEICAFYVTQPLAMATGWNQGVVGLTIGFAAMFLCGALVNALNAIRDNPIRFLRTIPFVQTFIGKGKQDD